jgi:hypothetical protein
MSYESELFTAAEAEVNVNYELASGHCGGCDGCSGCSHVAD